MRRIGVLLHPAELGGLHNLFAELHYPLREYGLETVALLPDGVTEPVVAEFSRLRVPFVRAGYQRIRKDPWAIAHSARTLWRDIQRLAAVVFKQSIDVLQVHGLVQPHAWFAARSTGTPVVLSLNSDFTPRPLRWAAVGLALRASAILAEGEGVVRAHWGLRWLGERVQVFYPPADRRRFYPDDVERKFWRARLGVGPEEVLVGTAGNRGRQKAHEHMVTLAIRMCARPGLRWSIAGREVASNRAYYEEEVLGPLERAGLLGTTFDLIELPSTDMNGYYNALDVFVLTSRAEGVATSTIEAMACGRPVVAFDVGSVRDVVAGGAGKVVPYGDLDAFEEALVAVLDDKAGRRRAGAKALSNAHDQLTLDRSVAVHRQAYERALGP